MRAALTSAAALLLGFAMLQMGNALQGTLLALRGQAEGFPAFAVGAIMSGFFAGMGLGSFIAPGLIKRAGHMRAFAAFASLASAAALAHVLFVNIPAWLIIRAFTGFCFAGLLMVVESWLNASVDSRSRGGLLAIYAATGLGAGAIGQLQISLAEPTSFVLFALVSITLSLALVPSSLSRAAAPGGDEELPEGKLDIPVILKASPFGAGAMVLVGMSVGSFFALGPVFAQSRELGTASLGLFMALATGAAMVSQFPLGRLSDRTSRRLVASGSAAAACAVLFAFWSLPTDRLITLGLGALLGATLFPTQAIAAAQVNDRVERRHMVAAAGTLVLLLSIGAASGPVITGYLIDRIGGPGFLLALFAYQGGIVLLGVGRLIMRPGRDRHRRGAVPALFEPVLGALNADGSDQGDLFAGLKKRRAHNSQ
ncbi:MAG: MFS transporter [Oceanicaulis sp.]